MSGIYNIFLKWAPTDKSQTAAWGRHHLTFANRYEADEFYRLMQTVRNANTPLFPGLVRNSPQFWCHSGLLWHSVHDVQALGFAEDFRQTLSSVLVNDGGEYAACLDVWGFGVEAGGCALGGCEGWEWECGGESADGGADE